MNSLHDLGGMHGFGPAWTLPEQPLLHSDAERRVLRLMMGLMAAGWCDTDGYRAAVEALPAAIYVRECFPWNYLLGLEAQLQERGLLQPGDIEAWAAGGRWPARVAAPPAILPPGDESAQAPRFAPGDRVRLGNRHPQGHTRLPRYLRGQSGTILAHRGVFDLPDAIAARIGRRPQPVYTVRFAARDIWGDDAAARDWLHAEIFQDYIDDRVEA
jgi:nitrile hydratase